MGLRKRKDIEITDHKYFKGINLSLFIANLTYFLIPFLGGNHLSLFYITIDRFWIETTFIMFLIFTILMFFYEDLRVNRNVADGSIRLKKLAFYIIQVFYIKQWPIILMGKIKKWTYHFELIFSSCS